MEKAPLHDAELGQAVAGEAGRRARSRAGLGPLGRTALLGLLTAGALLVNFGPSLPSWEAHSCSHGKSKTFEELFDSRSGVRGQVDWAPCAANSNYSCAYVTVPKDYYNASAGYADIALLKVPATAPAGEQLGGIFLNPGGPGGSGVAFGERFGPSLSAIVEGRYDLIGFDPRGIANTRPIVDCFGSLRAYQEFKAGTVLERGFDLSATPRSSQNYVHLLDQHRQLMALQQAEFGQCAAAMGDELRYMSTSTVVRDIEEMSSVLYGKQARINFFGGSYGTILGAYLVNMLPAAKLGRVLIDGVASAPQWANRQPYLWLHDWLSSTEHTFDWFLNDCAAAGPEGCALVSREGEAPWEIERKLMAYLDKLFYHPLPVIDTARPGLLTSGAARSVLYSTTNGPGLWPVRAEIFAEALAGNATRLYEETVRPFDRSGARGQTDLSRAAVACPDSEPFESEAEWPSAYEMVNRTYYNLEASPHFGGSVSLIEPDGGCQFFLAKAPERFTGPWNNTLDTPILIVSNTADPITPVASGRELSGLMGDSARLLIQNSAGHCSLGSVSACTQKWYRDYFTKGLLPEEETVCEIDKGYFPKRKNGAEEEAVRSFASDEERELHELSSTIAEEWVDWLFDGYL